MSNTVTIIPCGATAWTWMLSIATPVTAERMPQICCHRVAALSAKRIRFLDILTESVKAILSGANLSVSATSKLTAKMLIECCSKWLCPPKNVRQILQRLCKVWSTPCARTYRPIATHNSDRWASNIPADTANTRGTGRLEILLRSMERLVTPQTPCGISRWYGNCRAPAQCECGGLAQTTRTRYAVVQPTTTTPVYTFVRRRQPPARRCPQIHRDCSVLRSERCNHKHLWYDWEDICVRDHRLDWCFRPHIA